MTPLRVNFCYPSGLVYQNDGKHDEAVDAFARALQIKRVNEGLYSTGQLLMRDFGTTHQKQYRQC